MRNSREILDRKGYSSTQTNVTPIDDSDRTIVVWGDFIQYSVILTRWDYLENKSIDDKPLIVDVDYTLSIDRDKKHLVNVTYTGEKLYDNFNYSLVVHADIDMIYANSLSDEDIEYLIHKFPATYYGLKFAGLDSPKHYEWFRRSLAKGF